MRVLLISIMGDNPLPIETSHPPLSLGFLAAYARQRMHADFKFVFSNGNNIREILEDFKPELVGITVLSHYFDNCEVVAHRIKEWKNIPIIIGGQHISAIPECLTHNMDIAVIGEGEETFAEILQYYSENELSSELEFISGIAYKKDDILFKTSPRPLISNLDAIPLPDRSLFNINPFDTQMLSSRGCPFRCEFCSSSHFWGGVRWHSPERVVDEIMELVNVYDVKFLTMSDDLFACNLHRLNEIAEVLEKRMHGREPLQMATLVRASVMTPEIAKILRKMGIKDFAIGFESGSDKLLKRIKGSSASVEDNFKAVDIIRSAGGISIVGSVIIGIPGETVDDAYATLDMIAKLPINGGEAYLASPFPGTKFWDIAVQKGLVHKDMNWKDLSLGFDTDSPIIINDAMSRNDIYRYWQDANRLMHEK